MGYRCAEGWFARVLEAVFSKLQIVCMILSVLSWLAVSVVFLRGREQSRVKSFLTVFINDWQGCVAKMHYSYLPIQSELN